MESIKLFTALSLLGLALGIFYQRQNQGVIWKAIGWSTLFSSLVCFVIATGLARGLAYWIIAASWVGILNIYLGNQKPLLHKQTTIACGIFSVVGVFIYAGAYLL